MNDVLDALKVQMAMILGLYVLTFVAVAEDFASGVRKAKRQGQLRTSTGYRKSVSKINLRYFTASELLRSGKAMALGLDNTPKSDEIWDNLQELGEHILDPAREALGMPIVINSGYRSKQVNKAVGGAPNSQHTKGEAVDITCRDNNRLLEVLGGLPYDQLITYLERGGRIRRIHVSYRKEGNRKQRLSKRV